MHTQLKSLAYTNTHLHSHAYAVAVTCIPKHIVHGILWHPVARLCYLQEFTNYMKRELGLFQRYKKTVHDATVQRTEKQRALHHTQHEFEYHWNPVVDTAISNLKMSKFTYEQLKAEAAQVGFSSLHKRNFLYIYI